MDILWQKKLMTDFIKVCEQTFPVCYYREQTFPGCDYLKFEKKIMHTTVSGGHIL